jgi:putative SOS response-associated peptidase YedK
VCGRYQIKDTDALTEHLRRTFRVPDWVPDRPRYNIVPGELLPVIVEDAQKRAAVKRMRWGYVPFWDRAEKPKLAPANARSEGAYAKGMFRQSIQRRRCIVPASGFYEWRRLNERLKVPYDIHLKGGRPCYFAGIYEPASEVRPETYLIFTTAPNELVANIHARMPVILGDDVARAWIEPGEVSPEAFADFMRAYPAAEMEAVALTPLVNNPRNDGPEVLVPASPVPETLPSTPPAPQGELF